MRTTNKLRLIHASLVLFLTTGFATDGGMIASCLAHENGNGTQDDIEMQVDEADAFIREQLQPLHDNEPFMNALSESMDQSASLSNLLTVITRLLTDVEAGKRTEASLSTIKNLALIARNQIPLARQELESTIEIFRKVNLDRILATPEVSTTLGELLETSSGQAFLLSSLQAGGVDTEILRSTGFLEPTVKALESEQPIGNEDELSRSFAEGEFTETLERLTNEALETLSGALNEVMDAETTPDLIAINSINAQPEGILEVLLKRLVSNAFATGGREPPSIFDKIFGTFEQFVGYTVILANTLTLNVAGSYTEGNCLINEGRNVARNVDDPEEPCK